MSEFNILTKTANEIFLLRDTTTEGVAFIYHIEERVVIMLISNIYSAANLRILERKQSPTLTK